MDDILEGSLVLPLSGVDLMGSDILTRMCRAGRLVSNHQTYLVTVPPRQRAPVFCVSLLLLSFTSAVSLWSTQACVTVTNASLHVCFFINNTSCLVGETVERYSLIPVIHLGPFWWAG